MILRILSGSVIALGLGLYAESADAAQTFLCSDGRVLNVELADLERAKRDEPCVAQHFAAGDFQAVSVPLPVKRPAGFELRPLKETAETDTSRLGRRGDRADAVVDYRNVRIINPSRDGSTWFTHRR